MIIGATESGRIMNKNSHAAGSEFGNGVVLDDARHSVCLDAVYEIDALTRLLSDQVINRVLDEDNTDTRLVVRGIAGRLLRLTSVLMSGIGDPEEPTERLEEMTYLTGVSQG